MGNYEIQAKIDIERHPEWTALIRERHLRDAKEKDVEQARKDHPDEIWITTDWRRVLNTDHYVPFTIEYEPHWYDAQPIISPNVFRWEVLGNVRI